MVHNNYYNNYIPYNNNYFKTAPDFPNSNIKMSEEMFNEESNNNSKQIDNELIFDDLINDNKKSQDTSKESNESFSINNERLSILGFTLNSDDILIIGIAIFLFMENRKDYLLILILGLILFDISVDTFKSMDIFKHLFNPT